MAGTIATVALFTLGNFAVSWWSGEKAKKERDVFAKQQAAEARAYQENVRAYQNKLMRVRAENEQRKYDKETALKALSGGDQNMLSIKKYLDSQEKYKQIPPPKPPKRYSSGLFTNGDNEEYNAMVRSYTTIGGLIVFLIIIAFILYKYYL